MTSAFDPLRIRDIELPNRVWMSPMCTYSADPTPEHAGRPTDFHQAHYVARASGGAGLVVVEASGVVPEGRISPYCLGFWDDDQIPVFARLADAIRAHGAVPGIQLAHAGRKASTDRAWLGGGYVGEDAHGWSPVGSSAVAFPSQPVPHELTVDEIAGVAESFAAAARRADVAGYDVVEIHAAHGYLLHSFLSPVANQRTDEYGGSLENRARIVLEVVDAVRAALPAGKALFLRLSATDWIDENPEDDRDSWTPDQAVQLVRWIGERGVDLVDVSSGGIDIVPIPHDRDYQTRNAARVRSETDVLTAAVGRIATAEVAEELVQSGRADAVFVGRAMLRTPSWANDAATALGRAPRFLEQYGYVLQGRRPIPTA